MQNNKTTNTTLRTKDSSNQTGPKRPARVISCDNTQNNEHLLFSLSTAGEFLRTELMKIDFFMHLRFVKTLHFFVKSLSATTPHNLSGYDHVTPMK